mmetsp:Transcript_74874/g.169575  ORF Transcript_74874/g.169575 Transcript_74874/m.169575 type:complete len:181 (-) Transcript_74874:83-625(-)
MVVVWLLRRLHFRRVAAARHSALIVLILSFIGIRSDGFVHSCSRFLVFPVEFLAVLLVLFLVLVAMPCGFECKFEVSASVGVFHGGVVQLRMLGGGGRSLQRLQGELLGVHGASVTWLVLGGRPGRAAVDQPSVRLRGQYGHARTATTALRGGGGRGPARTAKSRRASVLRYGPMRPPGM